MAATEVAQLLDSTEHERLPPDGSDPLLQLLLVMTCHRPASCAAEQRPPEVTLTTLWRHSALRVLWHTMGKSKADVSTLLAPAQSCRSG